MSLQITIECAPSSYGWDGVRVRSYIDQALSAEDIAWSEKMFKDITGLSMAESDAKIRGATKPLSYESTLSNFREGFGDKYDEETE